MTATAPHTVFAASQLHAPSTLGIDITFWEALLLDKTLISGQVPEHQVQFILLYDLLSLLPISIPVQVRTIKLTHVSVSELPTGSDKCRIFLPGATTTSFDWSPDRLNVYCDKFGRVFDVRIG
ncbi:hypothetical protein BCR44DRAFT_25798 [Catenaria anguillulae PL171]|uniref:Uncharacterized protein n=1 Tax=Catenaria anguillulae PL171 TaxID=765915 RepID=A0A1Y2HLT9_9FUNG|nr:hypothetical protein BCR44DRAFT_25798 [Catenaria anguillulae PL171]